MTEVERVAPEELMERMTSVQREQLARIADMDLIANGRSRHVAALAAGLRRTLSELTEAERIIGLWLDYYIRYCPSGDNFDNRERWPIPASLLDLTRAALSNSTKEGT